MLDLSQRPEFAQQPKPPKKERPRTTEKGPPTATLIDPIDLSTENHQPTTWVAQKGFVMTSPKKGLSGSAELDQWLNETAVISKRYRYRFGTGSVPVITRSYLDDLDLFWLQHSALRGRISSGEDGQLRLLQLLPRGSWPAAAAAPAACALDPTTHVQQSSFYYQQRLHKLSFDPECDPGVLTLR